MLPLIPIILSVAPTIARWVFGNNQTAQTVVKEATKIVGDVTGVPDAASPLGAAQVKAQLETNPELQTKLQLQLAQLAAQHEEAQRQADLDELKASFADIASARSQTVTLAQAKSTIAWGAPLVSALILLIFAGTLLATYFRAFPAGAEALTGAVPMMAMAVVSYWLGSSRGSDVKNHTIAQLASKTPPSQDGDPA